MGKGSLTTHVGSELRERVLAKCRDLACSPSDYLRTLIVKDLEGASAVPRAEQGEGLAKLVRESVKSALAEALPRPEPAPARETHLPHYLRVALENCPHCQEAMRKFIDDHLEDAMNKILDRIEKLEKERGEQKR